MIWLARRSTLEFWEACDFSKDQSDKIEVPTSTPHWNAPPLGFLKINCDGAFNDSHKSAAIGICCRNASGVFPWGLCDKVKSLSAFMIEALALHRALLLAKDLALSKVIFECDCKMLVSCFQHKHLNLVDWRCRGIINDISVLMASETGFSLLLLLV